MNNRPEINFDIPLRPDSALCGDKLSREGFSRAAASTLRTVSSSEGLVVSLEGAWGSGKTSVLALIEAILNEDSDLPKPLIVHFNPWLIGEKDALLRHFLSRVAGAIKLSDHTRDGKKVASEIKAYAHAFDLVKLIPGAEPWASIIKSVVVAAGSATGAVAEYKTPDIEAYKQRVEAALRTFPRPIIVFIDDIDRLFPLEVFEMIRIIKAVGGLPRVGYVVAWDPQYVGTALETLGIPNALSYLDKVVQVRMSLPRMTKSAHNRLVDDALGKLDAEATASRFSGDESRLARLYHYGLAHLLEQPRDIARVFNAVSLFEPLLRKEIVFADILGLTALSVKAPAVVELLRKEPSLFVGPMGDDFEWLDKSKDVVENGGEKRNAAYETSTSPNGARQVVHCLFPLVAKAEDSYGLGNASYADGHIAHPARLTIALQLSLADGDVSIWAAKQFLILPPRRNDIVASLTEQNCNEFLGALGDVGKSLGGAGISDLAGLCIDLVRLAERPLFLKRAEAGAEFLRLEADDIALRSVSLLVAATDASQLPAIAEKIATDPIALSCAAEVISQNYDSNRQSDIFFVDSMAASKDCILSTFAANILEAAKADELFNKNSAGFILWKAAKWVPTHCPEIFKAINALDRTLDKFALRYLGASRDSTNGVAYSLPRDETLHSVFCPLDELKTHAENRLKDEHLQYPVRAAWRSVIEGRSIYGVDGSYARH